MSDALTIARDYFRRGWHPIPIPYRKKGPTDKEWNKRELTEDTLPQYFNGAAQNVGVQLGASSRGLTDIDLDCPEALKLAPYFLPETNSIFGRASKPRSHLLYYINDAIDKGSDKLTGVDKSCIVELRMGGGAKGAQTVFPR
jgi:Bifunctional DNA primase/polymerase, N-terminal